MHLSEKTIEKEVVFEGRIITVRKDKAELEDGTVAGRELVIHSGGVCVVPLTKEGKIGNILRLTSILRRGARGDILY